MKYQSLQLVQTAKPKRRVARVVFGGILLAALVLTCVPWQQTVVGSGQVTVFSPMDRPQSIEAMIPGRLVSWAIQEGQIVKKGDVLGAIEDIDSKFLDAQQPRRLREQRDFAVQTRNESQRRVAELEQQRTELSSARQNALKAAEQAIQQAIARERASRQLVKQSEQTFQIAQKVAKQSAQERANQAKDRIAQAEQTLTAAQQQADTMRMRLARISGLESQGLRSKQDLEFAQNDMVKATTEVTRATKALEIARKDLNVGRLAQDQASFETERAEAALRQAQANLEVAQRDVTNAQFNLNRLQNDTAAGLARVSADVQSAKESLAKNSGDIQKVENDLGNLELRTRQQTIVAPCDGRVARVLQVGAGTTVKSGDQLAIIAPTTTDRAVELYVTDNDLPLLRVGRPVRLQFAGWPAVQFGGFPSVAVGTFGGRVAVIDPMDDGSAKFRVVVKPDQHILGTGRKDIPWPDPALLRPGAEAVGWIQLDKVPLGFELWRQFNGFPARAPKPTLYEKKGTEYGANPKSDKKEKDPMLGPIKLKSKG